MTSRFAFILAVTLVAAPALGQDFNGSSQSSTKPMASLLKDGYEIKAAVPNGSKFVVFMQKDQSAYACDFVNVTNARCGAIN